MKTTKSMSNPVDLKDHGIVRSTINEAITQAKEVLESEGYSVPSFSVTLKDVTKMSFQPKKKFTKLYEDYLNSVEQKYGFNVTEKGIIMTLIKNIGYENNLLCHSNGDALMKKDLIEILGLSHNVVDSHMKSLIEKGVFAKLTVKRSVNFYLNPYIAYRGVFIDKTLLNMFKNTKF